MKLSIVTPSFNQSLYLRRTIESVITQQGNFEIQYLVMDGGSTDDTLSLLEEYRTRLRNHPRISFDWHCEPDNGQSDAINKGLRLATGDVLAFINSDDYYLPGAFQTVADIMAQPTTFWLYGLCQIVDEHDRPMHGLIQRYRNLLGRNFSFRRLLIANYIAQPATFWKRKLYDELGGLAESEQFAMDYEYWCRLGSNHPATACREYLAAFRRHGQSKSTVHTKQQFADARRTAGRYTDNKLLLGLHSLHDVLTLAVYRMLHHETGK